MLNTQPIETKMPIAKTMFPKIIESMTDDGKLRLLESNGTFADYIKTFGVEDTDADEISLTERAYEKMYPENLEPIEKIKKSFATIEQQLNDSLYNLFKVCCLCTSNKNRLMWSHYADSHKGIWMLAAGSWRSQEIITLTRKPWNLSGSKVFFFCFAANLPQNFLFLPFSRSSGKRQIYQRIEISSLA